MSGKGLICTKQLRSRDTKCDTLVQTTQEQDIWGQL